jgi:hypothetical protein
MSDTARTDDIDDFLSSVRNLITHKQHEKRKADRLVLQPDQRIGLLLEDADALADALSDGLSGDDDPSNVMAIGQEKPTDRAGLEATIAELEAAVTAQSGDWEPDDGEDLAHSEWAASAFDGIEVDAAEMPDLQEAFDAEPAPDVIAELETAVMKNVTTGLDQDALRALVAATVRDELAGELGERITQNVRKLVRREINRVLAHYDMGTD